LSRRFLTFGVAAALAALGIVLVMAYVGGANARAIDDNDPVTVIAASKPIPAGISVLQATDQGDTKKMTYPKGALPTDYLTHFTPAQYRMVLTQPLETDQLVLRGMLGSKALTSGGLVVPEGDVGQAITVCQTSAVAGYIGPGSMVSVLNTAGVADSCDGHQSPAGKFGTTVELSKVLVIKVQNQQPATGTPGSAITPPGTPSAPGCAAVQEGMVCVILAVTPPEAVELANFNAAGYLSLVLVPPGTVPAKAGTKISG
jgi:pilus assembly protein CpaB